MNDPINILFVAFEFPPLGGAGVQRSLKFVKYLPQYNINPIVITIEESDIKNVIKGNVLDYTHGNELPPQTIIERIHCEPYFSPRNKLSKWLHHYFKVSEDFKQGWKPALDAHLPAIIEKYKPSAIYITLPPFAMAPLWVGILKNYDIPLISDFRDAWSQWCFMPNGTFIHYLLKLKQERAILNRSAKIICSSKETMLDFKRVHPSINPSKFSVITNGFDGNLTWNAPFRITSQKSIIIGYVGSFYYDPKATKDILGPWWKKPLQRMLNYVPRKEDWLYRSPYFFLKAIKALVETTPDLKEKLQIHFAGHTPYWLKDQISTFGLDSLCTHHGYMNHEAILAFQTTCDALLITSSKVLGGRDYSIAGKTFEYYMVGKPVIAFVTEGAQKDILELSGMALVCDPDETSASAEKIARLINGETLLYPNKDIINRYQRSTLTADLAKVIRSSLS